MTERLITDQTEITGLTTVDWPQPMWRETTLITDRALQFATAKTYVFSDSVLCLGRISDEPVKAWGKQDQVAFGNALSQRFGSDRRGADGVRVEKFPSIHNIGNSRRDSKDDRRLNQSVNQSNSKEGSSSCQCTMTLTGQKRGNKDNCIANALTVTEYARRFTQGHWSFLGPGSEKKWCATHVNKPAGECDKTAEGMLLNFAESVQPAFRASSPFERGELKCKGKPFTSTVVMKPKN